MNGFLLVSLLACSGGGAGGAAAPAGMAVAASPLAEVKTKHGLYVLKAHTVPEAVPLSELFELRVTVFSADGAPAEGVTLVVDASMPEHGHGMATRPETVADPAGGFVTRGMKFHMPGNWVYSFVVEGPAGVDRAEVAVRL